jgi:hypothetical protein
VRSEVELLGRVALDADTQHRWKRVNLMWICVNTIVFPVVVLLVKVTENHTALPMSLLFYFTFNQSLERLVAEKRLARDILIGLALGAVYVVFITGIDILSLMPSDSDRFVCSILEESRHWTKGNSRPMKITEDVSTGS